MRPLTCADARRHLDAFHDGELSIAEEFAVSAHLDACGECAARSADVRHIRGVLQSDAPGRSVLSNEEAVGLTAAVVSRLKAERDVAFVARLRLMFDDMHLVYAGVGAAAATLACVIVVLGMMRFATKERPDSLFAIMNVLGMPLECDAVVDVVDDMPGCRERLAERFQRANETTEQDAVFALDSLVIDHGKLASLDVLKAGGRRTSRQAAVIEELLDATRRSRMDSPGALSNGGMMRMVARETVRAGKPQTVDLQLPAGAKKGLRT